MLSGAVQVQSGNLGVALDVVIRLRTSTQAAFAINISLCYGNAATGAGSPLPGPAPSVIARNVLLSPTQTDYSLKGVVKPPSSAPRFVGACYQFDSSGQFFLHNTMGFGLLLN